MRKLTLPELRALLRLSLIIRIALVGSYMRKKVPELQKDIILPAVIYSVVLSVRLLILLSYIITRLLIIVMHQHHHYCTTYTPFIGYLLNVV